MKSDNAIIIALIVIIILVAGVFFFISGNGINLTPANQTEPATNISHNNQLNNTTVPTASQSSSDSIRQMNLIQTVAVKIVQAKILVQTVVPANQVLQDHHKPDRLKEP